MPLRDEVDGTLERFHTQVAHGGLLALFHVARQQRLLGITHSVAIKGRPLAGTECLFRLVQQLQPCFVARLQGGQSGPQDRVDGFGLLLQGLVEIIRCVICLREGEWPSREHDVEEVDVDKLKEMVHVKDEDIAALDKYVVNQDGGHAK